MLSHSLIIVKVSSVFGHGIPCPDDRDSTAGMRPALGTVFLFGNVRALVKLCRTQTKRADHAFHPSYTVPAQSSTANPIKLRPPIGLEYVIAIAVSSTQLCSTCRQPALNAILLLGKIPVLLLWTA